MTNQTDKKLDRLSKAYLIKMMKDQQKQQEAEKQKIREHINNRMKYCTNLAKEFEDGEDDIAMEQMYARIDELKEFDKQFGGKNGNN